MNRTADNLSEKITHLSEEQLAEVAHFVELLQVRGDHGSVRASSALSEPAFEAVWNNPEDDVYDAL
jgi:hypothetical protein